MLNISWIDRWTDEWINEAWVRNLNHNTLILTCISICNTTTNGGIFEIAIKIRKYFLKKIKSLNSDWLPLNSTSLAYWNVFLDHESIKCNVKFIKDLWIQHTDLHFRMWLYGGPRLIRYQKFILVPQVFC